MMSAPSIHHASKTSPRQIRARRRPKPAVDPWQPLGTTLERERLPDGDQVSSLTVFLAGRECPFTCVFCDLWRYTTDEPTPVGAIPAQLRQALEQLADELPPDAYPETHLKLYNASNFFDDKAVPSEDDEAIADLAAPFAQVVVECHPKLVGRRCRDFGQHLDGRLQVAMGLETIHPEALPRLGKGATLDDFRRAADFLRQNDLGLRAFVLIGAPFVPSAEAVDWVERSVAFALEQGAEHVVLIPVRGGNGELERLQELGHFTPPTLTQVEEALERCLPPGGKISDETGVVTVDTWDLERLVDCPACGPERIARLGRMSLSGVPEPSVRCDADRRAGSACRFVSGGA